MHITMVMSLFLAVGLIYPAAEKISAHDPAQIQSRPLSTPIVETGPLFTRLGPEQTGVRFVNPVRDDHPLTFLYITAFAGGGVCIGDFDDDGRPDLYLVSQTGPDRLFRQVGPFRFQDVTDKAGLLTDEAWGAGATFVDIENDGDLDLYVCNFSAANRLYLNQGDGTFVEAAAAAGLDFHGSIMMASFADYDRDGDADLYLLTNRIYVPVHEERWPKVRMDESGQPTLDPEFRERYYLLRRADGRSTVVRGGQQDYLYQNNGDGTFRDVTDQSGIDTEGCHHGLGAVWWDYNHDGWTDLYVPNDYWDPDCLYRNNGDGTFTDVVADTVPHTPWFSMGADAADINNDGLIDFLAADMSATTHYKQKTTMGEMGASNWFLETAEPRQHMRNALYLNTGIGRFKEIAHLAGLASTDWTWSVKFGDLDNDGLNDVFFTNGVVRSLMDADIQRENEVIAMRFGQSGGGHFGDNQRRLLQAEFTRNFQESPRRPEANLAFQNLGDLRFEDRSADWGLDDSGISFGAAFADLDRDGDLDIVVKNVDEPASIYRNTSSSGHRVLIRLRGVASNRFGLGALARIRTPGSIRVRRLRLVSGYISASEPLIHLGDSDRIEHLEIQWSSGRV